MILFNWKANGNKALALEIVNLGINNSNIQEKNVVILPPLHLLSFFYGSSFFVGAQNISQFENGAYTGEFTAQMLADFGGKFALVGHSERRTLFNETNDVIAKKISQMVKCGITPVLCVGESLSHRKSGKYFDVLTQQMEVFTQKCIIAYEPVWAIGTGKVPSNQEIDEISVWIKENYQNPKVLYGGSVSSQNIAEIAKTHIDGVLVGGASLKPQEVSEIIKYF
jgi:triosephosphate isomerase